MYICAIALVCFLYVTSIDCREVAVQSTFYIVCHNLVREAANFLNSRSKLKTPIWSPIYLVVVLCVLFSNLLGLLPYSYTVTSSIVVVFFLSFGIFVLVNFLAVVAHGWGFLGLFLPKGIPVIMAPLLVVIEMFSYIARVISLTIRLFANMMSGHTLLKVLLTLAWSASSFNLTGMIVPILFFPVLAAIIALETAIGFLQAYVFMVLTSLYFGDAINLH